MLPDFDRTVRFSQANPFFKLAMKVPGRSPQGSEQRVSRIEIGLQFFFHPLPGTQRNHIRPIAVCRVEEKEVNRTVRFPSDPEKDIQHGGGDPRKPEQEKAVWQRLCPGRSDDGKGPEISVKAGKVPRLVSGRHRPPEDRRPGLVLRRILPCRQQIGAIKHGPVEELGQLVGQAHQSAGGVPSFQITADFGKGRVVAESRNLAKDSDEKGVPFKVDRLFESA